MPKKILVIDDDVLVIRAIDKFLKSSGYEVVTAQSGQEALEKIGSDNFDLIISDIRMPGMDGIETLKKIRELGLQQGKEKLPAIIITGYAGGDDVYRKAGELGIAECIYKPFELDEFIGVIKKNLELPPKLREISVDYKLLDDKFVSLTKDTAQFLQGVKNRFDELDRLNTNEQKQIDFIETNKKEIFKKLDSYFDRAWEIVKGFERDKYIVHQSYYQQILGYLLLELIETNRHVYQKPLGYSGDFIMMNYIYDYNGNDRYLGKSSYEKLINNYTCNIPISHSNIKRKEFLKEKIMRALDKRDKVKILSIACGPARELVELLREGRIIKSLLFKCLDFEKKALDYIENQIRNIELGKRQSLAIEYICKDITSIIRDRTLKEELRGQNLIYAFGIFDYLSGRMASRLTKELYQLLDKDGELIICNASLENSSHMAYYELLGEWHMVYRTREEMLSLTKDISSVADIKFEQPSDSTNYLFLSIKKL